MRQLASRWYVGVSLALGMTLYSCQTGEATLKKNFSGEELFNGIFFGQGEVATLIPEISNQVNMADVLTTDELEEVANVRQDLTAALKVQNPNFFNEFKSAIQSGNHLRIQETLRQTSELIFQGIMDISNVQTSKTKEQIASELGKAVNLDELKTSNGKFDRTKINNQLSKIKLFSDDDSNMGRAQQATCVAVAAVLVLAVAAAAAVIVFIFWIAAEQLSAESQLQQEMIVNSIATSLAN